MLNSALSCVVKSFGRDWSGGIERGDRVSAIAGSLLGTTSIDELARAEGDAATATSASRLSRLYTCA